MDRLQPGQTLQQDQPIRSNNGQYTFVIQNDGNLVLYRGGTALWASDTNGRGQAPYRLVLQAEDNHLMVYDRNNTAIWGSDVHSTGGYGAYGVMQDDGNFVIYCGNGAALWCTRTDGGQRSPKWGTGDRLAAPGGGVAVWDRCANGLTLYEGQPIRSPNGQYKFLVQSDGNVVLYHGAAALWASDTHGRGQGPYRLCMQTDSHLVAYDRNNTAIWASGVHGKGAPGAHLVVQDDGNVVVYDGANAAMWCTRTDGCQRSPHWGAGHRLM